MSARPLSPETLLAHEGFLRAVVRGLVRDEGELQDVVQETWLRGLGGVPAELGALRAWLARVAHNLALDGRRSRMRRECHERATARAGAVEGVDSAYARLATQREVVDAVLALEEPYRGVVLLRYFEGLAPVAIAARLARGPGTVRSQLARAHQILRERLDRRCGREAWSALALPLAWRVGPTGMLAAAAACGLLALAGLRWLASPGSGARPPTTLAAAAAQRDPTAGESSLVPASAPLDPARVALASMPPEESRPPRAEELTTSSLEERLALAVQLMRTLEADLTRVDPALVAEHAAFLAREGTGITRLLDGTRANLLLPRGGCASFSFATGESCSAGEPDLEFTARLLRTGLYGRSLGLLLDAGEVALEDVPDSAEPVPEWLPAERARDWQLLWSALDDAQRAEALGSGLVRNVYNGTAGHTFLLRVQRPAEHDLLVAFTTLVEEGEGCTILWRRIASWPVAEREGPAPEHREEHRHVPPGPPWLASLGTAARIELLGELRASARAALLDVPHPSRAEFARTFADARFARLLPRDRWDPLLECTSDGSWFSFEKATNEQRTAILGLDGELECVSASGESGLIADLGPLTDEELRAAWNGTFLADLGTRDRATGDFLFLARPEPDPSRFRGRRLADVDAARARSLGLDPRAPVAVGHVYLLRSLLFAERDELVLFQVLDRAQGGVSLAWKELTRFPSEDR